MYTTVEIHLMKNRSFVFITVKQQFFDKMNGWDARCKSSKSLSQPMLELGTSM
jgi:hypothetical protein